MANFTWTLDMTILVLLAIGLVALAGVLLGGRGGFLIAGFNMMPKSERAKVDVHGLCRFMGKVVLCISITVLLLLASEITGILMLNTIGLLILACAIITALIWANVHYMAPTRKK